MMQKQKTLLACKHLPHSRCALQRGRIQPAMIAMMMVMMIVIMMVMVTMSVAMTMIFMIDCCGDDLSYY